MYQLLSVKINLGLRVWVKCGFSSADFHPRQNPHFTYLKSADKQIAFYPRPPYKATQFVLKLFTDMQVTTSPGS